MLPSYWIETAGGWAQIPQDEYETIATAARACTSSHAYIQLPMVIKAEFAFQLPMGVTLAQVRGMIQ